MPIYEYKCSECGNTYEKRQKFSDPVDTVCNCERKAPVTRLTSAPALVFKGSGWYINDYARAGSENGKNGKSDGEKTGASSKDASSKSESSTKTADASPSASAPPAPAANTKT